MNKKLIAIIVVVAVSLVLFAAYKVFLSPKALEGEKSVSIEIIIENEDVNESRQYQTDKEFLLDLLKANQEELGIEFQTSDFGTMIIGMMNYTADNLKQEYFHIYVNGEDATTGAGDIPLKDGDSYSFQLKNY